MTMQRMEWNHRIRQRDLLRAIRGRRITRIVVENETVEVDAGNGFTKWEYTGRATFRLEVGP